MDLYKLETRVAEFIGRFEQATVDYGQLTLVELLVIDALNTWSNDRLMMGVGTVLKVDGQDACFVSLAEAEAILKELGVEFKLLYPCDGFKLPDDKTNQGLLFSRSASPYRMVKHTSGRLEDAIAIAAAVNSGNSGDAYGLWLTSATESCVSYTTKLLLQHSFELTEGMEAELRNSFNSDLSMGFSQDILWNITWRSVQHIAALSTRKYYNRPRALKSLIGTMHKLVEQLRCGELEIKPFDRAIPPSAILAMFERRFGILPGDTGQVACEKIEQHITFEFEGVFEDDVIDESQEPTDVKLYLSGSPSEVDIKLLECCGIYGTEDIVRSRHVPELRTISFQLNPQNPFRKERFYKEVIAERHSAQDEQSTFALPEEPVDLHQAASVCTLLNKADLSCVVGIGATSVSKTGNGQSFLLAGSEWIRLDHRQLQADGLDELMVTAGANGEYGELHKLVGKAMCNTFVPRLSEKDSYLEKLWGVIMYEAAKENKERAARQHLH